jgi:hypothetical protein
LRLVPANPNPKKDEPVKIPLEPDEALRALLAARRVTKDPTQQASQRLHWTAEQKESQVFEGVRDNIPPR